MKFRTTPLLTTLLFASRPSKSAYKKHEFRTKYIDFDQIFMDFLSGFNSLISGVFCDWGCPREYHWGISDSLQYRDLDQFCESVRAHTFLKGLAVGRCGFRVILETIFSLNNQLLARN